MVGLIIALILFAWRAFVSGVNPLYAYASSAEFLFWWYVISSAIGVVFFVLKAAGSSLFGAKFASKFAGMSKLVASLGMGGLIGASVLWGIVSMAVEVTLHVGGAWLLQQAALGAESINGLDKLKLIVGGLMVLIGVLVFRKKGGGVRVRTRVRSSSSFDDE